MRSLVYTNKGKREVNQDFVLIQQLNPHSSIYLIADGMGGYEQGDMAAKIVAESVSTFLSTLSEISEIDIQKAVNKANLAIRQRKQDLNIKMGATIGGVILFGESAVCFWVGDIKVFHFKNKKLHFESSSHTLMNEIINNGSITDSEKISKYRHVVTRSVQGEVNLSRIEYTILGKITDEDMLLICSDGAHDIFDGIQIQLILNSTPSVIEALKSIEERLQKDANDNFSIIALTSIIN